MDLGPRGSAAAARFSAHEPSGRGGLWSGRDRGRHCLAAGPRRSRRPRRPLEGIAFGVRSGAGDLEGFEPRQRQKLLELQILTIISVSYRYTSLGRLIPVLRLLMLKRWG